MATYRARRAAAFDAHHPFSPASSVGSRETVTTDYTDDSLTTRDNNNAINAADWASYASRRRARLPSTASSRSRIGSDASVSRDRHNVNNGSDVNIGSVTGSVTRDHTTTSDDSQERHLHGNEQTRDQHSNASRTSTARDHYMDENTGSGLSTAPRRRFNSSDVASDASLTHDYNQQSAASVSRDYDPTGASVSHQYFRAGGSRCPTPSSSTFSDPLNSIEPRRPDYQAYATSVTNEGEDQAPPTITKKRRVVYINTASLNSSRAPSRAASATSGAPSLSSEMDKIYSSIKNDAKDPHRPASSRPASQEPLRPISEKLDHRGPQESSRPAPAVSSSRPTSKDSSRPTSKDSSRPTSKDASQPHSGTSSYSSSQYSARSPSTPPSSPGLGSHNFDMTSQHLDQLHELMVSGLGVRDQSPSKFSSIRSAIRSHRKGLPLDEEQIFATMSTIREEVAYLVDRLKMLEDENRLMQVDQDLFNDKFGSLVDRYDVANATINTLSDKNRDLDAVNQSLAAENRKLTASTRELISEKEELLAVNQDLLAEKENLLVEKEDLLAEKEDVLAAYQDLKAEKEDLMVEKEDLLTVNQDLLAEKENLLVEKENLTMEKEDLMFDKEELMVEKENLMVEKENLMVEKEDLMAKNQDLAAANEDLVAANEELSAANKALTISNNELAAANEDLSDANKNLAADKRDLSGKKQNLSVAVRELTAAKDELIVANEEFAASNEDLVAERDAALSRADSLATKVCDLEAVMTKMGREFESLFASRNNASGVNGEISKLRKSLAAERENGSKLQKEHNELFDYFRMFKEDQAFLQTNNDKLKEENENLRAELLRFQAVQKRDILSKATPAFAAAQPPQPKPATREQTVSRQRASTLDSVPSAERDMKPSGSDVQDKPISHVRSKATFPRDVAEPRARATAGTTSTSTNYSRATGSTTTAGTRARLPAATTSTSSNYPSRAAGVAPARSATTVEPRSRAAVTSTSSSTKYSSRTAGAATSSGSTTTAAESRARTTAAAAPSTSANRPSRVTGAGPSATSATTARMESRTDTAATDRMGTRKSEMGKPRLVERVQRPRLEPLEDLGEDATIRPCKPADQNIAVMINQLVAEILLLNEEASEKFEKYVGKDPLFSKKISDENAQAFDKAKAMLDRKRKQAYMLMDVYQGMKERGEVPDDDSFDATVSSFFNDRS